VKQETPSEQIPKFYLNSIPKDTSFKKISQFVNAETIPAISLSGSGNDKRSREMPTMVEIYIVQ
jgi:hypothetical protein